MGRVRWRQTPSEQTGSCLVSDRSFRCVKSGWGCSIIERAFFNVAFKHVPQKPGGDAEPLSRFRVDGEGARVIGVSGAKAGQGALKETWISCSSDISRVSSR